MPKREFRYWSLAAAFALAFAPAPSFAQTLGAADYARALQAIVGQVYEGGVTIRAIRSEGQTLVIVLDGPSGWRRPYSDTQVSDLFMSGFCTDAPRDFFESGVTIRVDSLDGGRASRRGPLETGCDRGGETVTTA